MSKKKKSPPGRSASSKAKVVEKPISEAERLFKAGDYAGVVPSLEKALSLADGLFDDLRFRGRTATWWAFLLLAHVSSFAPPSAWRLAFLTGGRPRSIPWPLGW